MLIGKGEMSAAGEYAGSGLYAARDTLPERARSNAINIMSLYARALQEAQERQSAMSANTAVSGGSMSPGAPPCSTGDPEYDKKLREAIDYYNSCFDFTNRDDFDSFADVCEGMTSSEKYAAIYRKYQHCYGENFLDGKAADLSPIPSDYDSWRPVFKKFNEEVEAACGGAKGAAKARRETLYGGCESDYEVRQAIIEKYM